MTFATAAGVKRLNLPHRRGAAARVCAVCVVLCAPPMRISLSVVARDEAGSAGAGRVPGAHFRAAD